VKALVVGGAGFVGSHLVDRLLADGHQLDVVDDLSTGSLSNLSDARATRSGRLKIHQTDITDPEIADLVVRRSPDVVYLLAGRGSATAVDHAELTVVGGLRVLDAARRADVDKVVAVGSTAVYGEPSGGRLPFKEADMAAIDDESAATLALLGYLQAHRERHGVEFTLLVLSSVYGPRQRTGPVADLVRRCWGADGAAPEGPDRSDDLLFVDDAVDALVRASERGGGLVVNVGTGLETPAGELASVVRAAVAAAGGPAAAVGPAARGDRTTSRMAVDPARARMQLGWKPWTSLQDGIGLTVDALRP
jgi:UDP-glucose 4-epimerase